VNSVTGSSSCTSILLSLKIQLLSFHHSSGRTKLQDYPDVCLKDGCYHHIIQTSVKFGRYHSLIVFCRHVTTLALGPATMICFLPIATTTWLVTAMVQNQPPRLIRQNLSIAALFGIGISYLSSLQQTVVTMDYFT
jgi:hypothetical protein